MPVKKTKTVTAKPPMPHKFLVVSNYYDILHKGSTESGAVTYGTSAVQPGLTSYDGRPYVGIYQLIKIIRRKVTPVEIEEVACCDGVTGE